LEFLFGNLALGAVCLVDGFFPLVPSETMVIAASFLAAHGERALWVIPIVAAMGSFVGDHVSFFVGRMVDQPTQRRVFRNARSRALLEWAAGTLHERGGALIIAARFVPGGRTVATFAAGSLGMTWRRFAIADAAASILWAGFATALGYYGGHLLAGNKWLGLGLALLIGALTAGAGEVCRRILAARRSREVEVPPRAWGPAFPLEAFLPWQSRIVRRLPRGR
jgi:membrane-associated protein